MSVLTVIINIVWLQPMMNSHRHVFLLWNCWECLNSIVWDFTWTCWLPLFYRVRGNIKFEIVNWLNYFNMAWKVKTIAQNSVETVFPAQSVMLEVPSWIVGPGSLLCKCTMYIYFDWVEPCPDLEILLTMISNIKRQIRSWVLLCLSFVLVSSFLLLAVREAWSHVLRMLYLELDVHVC